MTKHELPKAYDFKSTEQRIYAMWEAGGFFKPHNDPNKPDFDPNVEPFVISIPPPNVTGELHIGHAIVSRAVFVGMREAVGEMKRLMREAALRTAP